MKMTRQALIREIIMHEDIETQEELANQLSMRGLKVTQATVSRDIKELRLIKTLSPRGRYRYTTAEYTEQDTDDRLIRIFSESVISVTSSDNLVVIKTLPASASAAAEAVDSLRWPQVLGTLAGDNTFLVILRSDEDAEEVVEKFRGMMRRMR